MPNPSQYRRVSESPLDGGLRDSVASHQLQPGQSPDCENVDFDGEAIDAVRGATKFGNRVAPRASLLTKVDRGLSPLSHATNKSVPMRGGGFFPYSQDLDRGGDFVANGTFPTQTFHARRQRLTSVTNTISFHIPKDERFPSIDQKGGGAPTSPASGFSAFHYDETIDEVFILDQKGGDRLAPMSWFIGVVNVGSAFETLTGAATTPRVSNWAICFGWLDAPEYGQQVPDVMRYKVGAGAQANVGTTGTYCTMAYRVVVFGLFVEPGKDYHLAISHQLDTGTPGTGANPTANWNADGTLTATLVESSYSNPVIPPLTHVASAALGTAYVWKGPTDSIDYLLRYGVRYSSRDACFIGMGMRCTPHRTMGNIPYGHDSAPLEAHGHKMVDRSRLTSTALSTPNALTSTHTAVGDAFIDINHEKVYWLGSTGAHGFSPFVGTDLPWIGIGNQTTGTLYNPEALRGYRLVLDGGAPASLRGAWFTLGSYSEPGTFRFTVLSPVPNFATWAAAPSLIQCLRWSARPLRVNNRRIYRTARDYTSTTQVAGLLRMFDLSGEAQLDDEVHKDLKDLLAAWPMDDGEGGVLREIVANREGFVFPYATPVSKNGTFKNRLFLSGEGEALTLDLSKDPVFEREFTNLLRSGSGGFAVEITAVFPEAIYDQHNFTATELQGVYGPTVIEWAARGDDLSGLTDPKPLLRLSLRTRAVTAGNNPSRRPSGFTLEVARRSDQLNQTMELAVAPWVGGGATPQFSTDATWVGKPVTIQVGVHPSQFTPGSFDVYMAMTPKDLFLPADGDPAGAEWAYYTTMTMDAKDLTRSMVVIGGGWRPGTLGQSAMNCRMLLDKVTVYVTSAPGALPAASGGIITNRDGKLSGGNALPQRELSTSDLLLPVGDDVHSVNVSESSGTVTPAGGTAFYSGDPEDSLKALRNTYLLVLNDKHEVRNEETLPSEINDFYFVKSVTTTGTSATLQTPYSDTSRRAATAYSLRVGGYTVFADDQFGRGISIGRGRPFVPGTSTIDNAVLVERSFTNLAPLAAAFGFRVYSSLSSASAQDIIPSWARGVVTPRRNPIRGLHGNEETLFFGAGPCFGIADDRWRTDSPRNDPEASLSFRATRSGNSHIVWPEAYDGLYYTTHGYGQVTASALNTNAVEHGYWWDFWVCPNSIDGFQTISWYGDVGDDPALLPGEAAGAYRFNNLLRLNGGRPELVIGSTDTLTAGGRPEKGLFVASGDVLLRAGEWTHVRWHLPKAIGTAFIHVPTLFINGRRVTVSVNARANTAGTNWITTANLVDSNFPEPRFVLGVARDSFLEPTSSIDVAENVINGLQVRAQRYAGWMHALDGKLSTFRTGIAQTSEMNALLSFDPVVFETYAEANTWETVTAGLTTSQWKAFIPLGEGVGHRPLAQLRDASNTLLPEYGVITSHPFIVAWAEMGSADEPYSFVTYGNRVFATKGGRVVQHDQTRGLTRWAGLLSPTNAPTFQVERKPLWRVSARTTGNPDNPPFTVSAADVQDRNSYYSTSGNNYLEQAFHEEMRWERDDAAAANQRNDVFAFKCLVRPTETAGRIPLYYQRDSLASGGIFLEIRDGRMVLGWYDTFLKQEQTIETDVPVFVTGSWHYVYVRKKWPKTSAGNWEDCLYRDNTTVQKDQIIVRVFPRFDTVGDGSGDPIRETNWDVKADNPSHIYPDSTANCISFTTLSSSDVDAAFTALGRVTPTTGVGALPPRVDTASTGGNNGTLTRNAAGFNSCFHADMVGMLVHWKEGATARLGRITSYTGLNIVAVTTIDGLGAVAANANVAFCVCIGVKLVKSTNYASSNRPDSAPYDIRVFGSPMAAQALTGVQRFRGDFGSFGYVSFREDDTIAFSAANSPAAFHDSFKLTLSYIAGNADPVEQGTDTFSGHIYASTAPGELSFNANGRNFTVVQSSQPNEDREVELDSSFSSINAQSLFWLDLVEVQALAGARRVFVTFYDPAFDDESGPSPGLTILPALEDQANPSGDAAILLEGLPVSRDGNSILRRVYMTNVEGATPHLVAEVDSTASSIAIFKSEAQIARERFLDFFNAAPPRCKYLAISQKALVYAGIVGQPDALRYSEPFSPTVVPLVNLLIFAGGRNSAITGVADLQGRLVVFKGLNAIWSVLIATGVSSTKLISTNHGCTAHNTIQSLDDRLYWHDPRGIMMFNGTSTPEYVSDPLGDFFKTSVDPRFFKYQSASINRERNQYILATKERDSDYPNVRISVEYDHATTGSDVNRKPAHHRFSRYRHPNITALSNVADRPGGQQRLVCGTEQGFVMWMDRSETRLIGMGPAGGYGSAGPLLAVSGAQTYAVPLFVSLPPVPVDETGVYDTELAGPRDVVVRWRVNGVEKTVVALGLHLFNGGVWLMTDKNIPAADLPSDGTLLSLGDALPYWESRWMPFDLPEQGRRAYWLNVFHKRETSGSVWVTVFTDLDETNPAIAAQEVELTNGLERIPLPFHFQWLKVRIERKTPDAATNPQSQSALDYGFTISDIVVRIQEQDRN